jgi:SHS2 domain-containing protein
MGSSEAFDHTADLGLRIRGTDLDDLFGTAAAALLDVIVANSEAVRVVAIETITLQADSPAELLATWLNELIFRSETKHRLYVKFEVHLDAEGRSLRGEIGGEPIDRDRHILDHEVKAVTHHGLIVRREGAEWMAELVLDV